MQTTEQLEKQYETAHIELNKLYNDFHEIPGYIRKKSGDELALQSAKRIFGRFNPDDKEAMQANNNNGEGVKVSLEDGSEVHLQNQLELYEMIVAFNKSKGPFCDENYIKYTNDEHYKSLMKLKFQAKAAKDALVGAYPTKAAGYAKAREIELINNKVAGLHSTLTEKATNNASARAASGPLHSEYIAIPTMRTPLLSSIPTIFQQAKSLFNAPKAKSRDAELKRYINSNTSTNPPALLTKLSSNLATAQEINAALLQPVSGGSEKRIEDLGNLLSKGQDDIKASILRSEEVNEDHVKDYNDQMKAELDKMKLNSVNHPSYAIRDIVQNIVSSALKSLKKFIDNVKSLFGNNSKSPAQHHEQ